MPGLVSFDDNKRITGVKWPKNNGAVVLDTDFEPDDLAALLHLCVEMHEQYGKGPYPELILIGGEAHSGIQRALAERYIELLKQCGLLPEAVKVHLIEGQGCADKDFQTLGLDVLSQAEIDTIRARQPGALNPNINAERKRLAALLAGYKLDDADVLYCSLKPPIDAAQIAQAIPGLFNQTTVLAYGGGFNYNPKASKNNERGFNESVVKNFFASCAEFIVANNFIMVQNSIPANDKYRAITQEAYPSYTKALLASEAANPLAAALLRNTQLWNEKILQSLVQRTYASLLGEDKLASVTKEIASIEKDQLRIQNLLADPKTSEAEAKKLNDQAQKNAGKLALEQETLAQFVALDDSRLSPEQKDNLQAKLKAIHSEGFGRNFHLANPKSSEALLALEEFFLNPALVDEFIARDYVALSPEALALIAKCAVNLDKRDRTVDFRAKIWSSIATDIQFQSVIADPLIFLALKHPELIDQCRIGTLGYNGAFLNINPNEVDENHVQVELGAIQGGGLQAAKAVEAFYLDRLAKANDIVAQHRLAMAGEEKMEDKEDVLPRVSGNRYSLSQPATAVQQEAMSDELSLS